MYVGVQIHIHHDVDGGYCSADTPHWPSVVDYGPALSQHWACFSCLLSDQRTKNNI